MPATTRMSKEPIKTTTVRDVVTKSAEVDNELLVKYFVTLYQGPGVFFLER